MNRNYDELPPSHQQTEQLKIFLDYAVMKKYLTPCYEILVLNSPMRYFSDIALRIEENVKIENKC
ncbi:hypothetical protein NQ314_001330 [Rhamnusium bicolor]|uniref:Maturase K n=1 Tax=Rhamnusium bicolor TaxID=1586634 RepID=A0AAV8ZV75_9CUCU|nr:hypothetical protein NQ314_001330 [Rhamnusium bicolor]